VLRYWNNDVLSNIDGVLEDILSTINDDPQP
jgi:very-short-patch-repair endonuclease